MTYSAVFPFRSPYILLFLSHNDALICSRLRGYGDRILFVLQPYDKASGNQIHATPLGKRCQRACSDPISRLLPVFVEGLHAFQSHSFKTGAYIRGFFEDGRGNRDNFRTDFFRFIDIVKLAGGGP